MFLEKYDVLEYAAPGAVFLLNSPFSADTVWDELPREIQTQILEKKLRFYVIDAYKVAEATGMGGRINTIMQTCFFAISGVLPRDEAIAQIKKAIEKTYGKRGPEVVRKNFAAVDETLANLHEVTVPGAVTSPEGHAAARRRRGAGLREARHRGHDGEQGRPAAGQRLPDRRHLAVGDDAVGEAEHRARDSRVGREALHPVQQVRAGLPARRDSREGVPGRSARWRPGDLQGGRLQGQRLQGVQKYTIQVAPEDCTGCTLCVEVCPAKDKANPKHKALDMVPQPPLREQERTNYEFFLDLPEADRTAVKLDVKGTQFLQPLFEYSGACSGCGETPYVKLHDPAVRRPAADRERHGLLVDLRRQPADDALRGRHDAAAGRPGRTRSSRTTRSSAWASASRSTRRRTSRGRSCKSLAPSLDGGLVEAAARRRPGQRGRHRRAAGPRRGAADRRSRAIADPAARRLEQLADYLVKKSVWIVGGDGWAYDIGYGGLDHVLSTGRNVNILVLDTEVYSNTGGQQSKATPMGAAAKFAMAGKGVGKKDLGLMAMAYGNVYVAQVAFGAKDAQTVQAFLEAEAYPGPSIIIAYSHCIAHGYDMAHGLDQQKLAVDSGYWPLYRFDPPADARGRAPAQAGLGRAQDRARQVHAQRDAVPRGRTAEPGAVPRPPRARAERRHDAGSRSTRSWRAATRHAGRDQVTGGASGRSATERVRTTDC